MSDDRKWATTLRETLGPHETPEQEAEWMRGYGLADVPSDAPHGMESDRG